MNLHDNQKVMTENNIPCLMINDTSTRINEFVNLFYLYWLNQ